MAASSSPGSTKPHRGPRDSAEADVLVEMFGGAECVGAITGNKKRTVENWPRRGIPGWVWPQLILAAHREGKMEQLVLELERIRACSRQRRAA